jgi:hypothetical protein
MLHTRERMQREKLVMQAALVWGLGKIDLEAFIETGDMGEEVIQEARLSPEQQDQVSQMMAAIQANGGKFIMPEEVFNGESR